MRCFIAILMFSHQLHSANALNCSVCGEGKRVTLPDSSFSIPSQPSTTCGDVELAGFNGELPESSCENLPDVIAEVCGCEANETIQVCSVCGDGQVVTAPDALFSFPEQPSLLCADLEAFGAQGKIPIEQCDQLPDMVKEPCKCANSTQAPDDMTTLAPIVAPIDIPIFPAPIPPPVPIEFPTEESMAPETAPPSSMAGVSPTSAPETKKPVDSAPVFGDDDDDGGPSDGKEKNGKDDKGASGDDDDGGHEGKEKPKGSDKDDDQTEGDDDDGDLPATKSPKGSGKNEAHGDDDDDDGHSTKLSPEIENGTSEDDGHTSKGTPKGSAKNATHVPGEPKGTDKNATHSADDDEVRKDSGKGGPKSGKNGTKDDVEHGKGMGKNETHTGTGKKGHADDDDGYESGKGVDTNGGKKGKGSETGSGKKGKGSEAGSGKKGKGSETGSGKKGSKDPKGSKKSLKMKKHKSRDKKAKLITVHKAEYEQAQRLRR